MAQSQIQEQTQQQKLQQTISQQQLLQSQLIELPVNQLLERIETEMNDNPALELLPPEDSLDWQDDGHDDAPADDDFQSQQEREERQSALDEALQGIGRDDEELPVYQGGRAVSDEREEIVYGSSTSFYDYLHQQVLETDLNDRQKEIMEYLIGSLDDDGLLRKSLESISDELAVYQDIDASAKEIGSILDVLKTFDPAGIGAQSLQECLLLQIERRDDSVLKDLMHTVISRHFENFTRKHWDKIKTALKLNDRQNEALMGELRKLTPKPGAAMGEVMGRNYEQITPDFIVETHDDGTITFSLNTGEVPQLQVSQSFVDLMHDYQQNKDGLSRQMKEALLYTKQKVDAAQGFIDAVRQRRHTLTVTMQAIINWQHRFFEDGDEASLRPMILKDIAEQTGLDLSTISRVSNAKYAQTRWGTFPLRYFFSDGYTTENGEELSTREIKAALREVIEGENKKHPLSDEALSSEMKKRGYPIARRTVTKYREQMGLPVARLRKHP